MSWSDPIVDEVRRARDAYAARFNYDFRAIFNDLKEQEQRSGRPLVSYENSNQQEPPNKSLQSPGLTVPASTSPEAASTD